MLGCACETLRHQARKFLLTAEVLSRTGPCFSATGRVSASRDCDGATGSFIA
jgi:hypothetical protein